MGTTQTTLKLLLAALALSFYTGCGGGDDPASVEVETIDHNFVFFNSCVAPCSDYKLYMHSLDSNTTTIVGDGMYQGVEAEYDIDRVNIAHKGKYYFSAYDGPHGGELWVYDPQVSEQAGVNPKMVADISPGGSDSEPYAFLAVGDKIYFSADDGTTGYELWVYDTSVAVSSANPGLVYDTYTGATNFSPEELLLLDGKIYMSGRSAAEGKEVFVYDPTVAASATNPQILADIRPGGANSNPKSFMAVNNKLSLAGDGVHGNEMWVYDPALATSATNPKLFFDTVTGSNNSNANNPISVGNKIYYSGYNTTVGTELFVLDATLPGSATNPQPVYDIRTGLTASYPYYLESHNGKIYFGATSSSSGRELYVYDPSVASSATNPNLLDINTGAGDSDVHHMTSIGGSLYFGVESGPTYTFGSYDDSAAFSPGVNPLAADSNDYADALYDMIPLTYTTEVIPE